MILQSIIHISNLPKNHLKNHHVIEFKIIDDEGKPEEPTIHKIKNEVMITPMLILSYLEKFLFENSIKIEYMVMFEKNVNPTFFFTAYKIVLV